MPLINISAADLAFLRELAHELATQSNRMTASPYFYVVRTAKELAAPPGYGEDEVLVDWQGDPNTYKTEAEARKLFGEMELSQEEIDKRVEALEPMGVHTVFEYHNVFFTEKGYRQHMELNGHNYGSSKVEPHSYVMHAFRNPEIKTLLEIVQRLGAVDLDDRSALDLAQKIQRGEWPLR